MVVFGERILVKVAVSRAGRAGMESAFTPAVYVEHHGRSGAESDRFVASELEKLKGLPWNLNGSLEAELLDWPLIAGPDALGIPILPVPAGMPPLPQRCRRGGCT